LRLWIVLDECNEEIIPGSYYLEPATPLGRLSKTFFLSLVLEFIRRRENPDHQPWRLKPRLRVAAKAVVRELSHVAFRKAPSGQLACLQSKLLGLPRHFSKSPIRAAQASRTPDLSPG
jgi:hypothetical protein